MIGNVNRFAHNRIAITASGKTAAQDESPIACQGIRFRVISSINSRIEILILDLGNLLEAKF
jgi:hypothetical protein